MNLSYLQNHYEVDEIELGYQFTTKAGVTYFLTFFSYPAVSDFLETKIYMFNIERSHHPIFLHLIIPGINWRKSFGNW